MTPLRALPVDSAPRRLIRGSLRVDRDGTIEIHLPHRLESPNKTLHADWRTLTGIKKAWRSRLRTVIADAAGLRSVARLERPVDALGLPPVLERRVVRIERRVPSLRNFIRDLDNQTYSAKPLLDQVTRCGFIRDDGRAWIDLEVTQSVSADGRDWTVIRIEVPPGASIPFPME